MKHQLIVKGPLDAEEVRAWVSRPLARLSRRLARFPGDAVHLRILVREIDGRLHAEAGVTLQLPSNTLAVSEEAGDSRTAVQEAFRELERLVEKEKARLRRTDTWQRSRAAFQRELLERVATPSWGVPSPVQSEGFEQQLRDVEGFVTRELRWLEASGDLVPGEVDPRDVVDAAFAGAWARGGKPPSRRRLLQSASAALRSELARAREAREQIHIEEHVPEIPRGAVSDEPFDFHQPDAGLRVEDFVAALSRTPEELEATADLLAALRDALGALPASWRQALQFSEVEGLDPVAIADALEVGALEVPDFIAHARAFLRERLFEAGVLERGSPSP